MKTMQLFQHISINATRILKDYKPLAHLQNVLYLHKKGRLYSLEGDQPEEVARLYATNWKDTNRLLMRLFRREPKYAVPIAENKLLIAMRRKIFLFDVEKKDVSFVTDVREGFSDPLNICPCSGKWLAIWGDYGQNPEHNEINIYGLKTDTTVEIIATFAAGKIRHIHNIIPKRDGGYYIFTGDQEKEAGIYQCDESFSLIEPIKVGKQKYRAVVGFDTEQGLLYATDAVNEQNYIYILRNGSEPEIVTELNGSCIYGCRIEQGYLFSTTVEPDENNRGITSWISSKKGKGILSNDSHLVFIDKNLKSDVVLKYKKDILPMKLMQYGSIQFPRGTGKDIWIYPVALKGVDGAAVKLERSCLAKE